MKIIALCINVPELDSGHWRDISICQKYPGSEWMPYFKDLAEREGFAVASGSEALRIKEPGDTVLVIQEERNPQGEALIQRGADPSLLFCFESPLYTPDFYDALPDYRKPYRNVMLFDGGTHHVYFPSFDLKDLDWEETERRSPKTCAVIANKHYTMLGGRYGHSRSWTEAIAHQLHDYRYDVMGRGVKEGSLDVYGKGWPNGFMGEVAPGQKLATLRKYRANFCPENVALPGYITEKLIQAMVAGCVPIYSGPPDLKKYIPHNHRDMEANRTFLRSHEGRKYSFQGFAEEMLRIVTGNAAAVIH